MGFLFAEPDCWTLWGPKQQEKKQAFFRISSFCAPQNIYMFGQLGMHEWSMSSLWWSLIKTLWEEINKILSFLRLLSDPILPSIIFTYLPTHCFLLSFLPNPLLCICFLSLQFSFSLLKQTNQTSFYSELMSHQTHLIINMPSTFSSECV